MLRNAFGAISDSMEHFNVPESRTRYRGSLLQVGSTRSSRVESCLTSSDTD